MSLRIRSSSLQEIDTRGCCFGFGVEQCIFPSLKMFRCRYLLDHGLSNGVNAVTVITRHEGRIHRSLDNDIRFQVGSRPFLGMEVPASCVVSAVVSLLDKY